MNSLPEKFLSRKCKGFHHFSKGKVRDKNNGYLVNKIQGELFDSLEIEQADCKNIVQRANAIYSQPTKLRKECFELQNRRYLGNKYKLLKFIEDIVLEKCNAANSFCDIFAGTGVVGQRFNSRKIKVISNDLLFANYVCLYTFLGVGKDLQHGITEKIKYLNNLSDKEENYFSKNFGQTYFTERNARKIGKIREVIENIAENTDEKKILICSLLYAVDKVANTVGHYDAFRKSMDMSNPIKLLVPIIDYKNNTNNQIYREDANLLIKKISCDVLYIDPPYNSRQYSDAYHLLENLAAWKKPKVMGIANKMDRSHIKSQYCLKSAIHAFTDLIQNADCKHILLSYNNTRHSRDGRSNARINDNEILHVLNTRGKTKIFQTEYKAFTTGKSSIKNNAERIFYCRVKKSS